MHINEMVAEAERTGQPSFSFEYFPPKTAQGVQNLYDRMERMYDFGPKFIDITWGAGGTTADLTGEIVTQAQTYFGLETCMHLTCTDMGEDKVNDALQRAYKSGCTNILALRGDPPRNKEKWSATDENFRYARDLVSHIRQKYGSHFDIGVAGYPEGTDDNKDEEQLLDHLKQKVDLGASFIVTQMFYDVDNFIRWVGKVRDRGITIPILPGIMPIATYASFIRRAKHMQCGVPDHFMSALESVKNDDAAVREVGKVLVADMCRKIVAAGIPHLHFYTMNLAQATRLVLEELNWMPTTTRPRKHALPWKQSLGLGRRAEDVRPVFWRNRGKSYVARTQDWDEFPNGRWGDSRSPAFGELDAYGIGLTGTNESNRKKWGEPKSIRDVADLFVRYIEKDIDSLPWSEAPLTSEADSIKQDLIDINRRGLLTINSQPAVNGAKSSDPIYGWGPPNGYVYQKAYVELLVPPSLFEKVLPPASIITPTCPNAVTWGVFPGKEIVQPTIVESISFLAWKDEAFRLGLDWSHCHDAGTPSRALIEGMMNDWYLINIVNNDFHSPRAIFELFEGLSVDELETPVTFEATANGVQTNGAAAVAATA
ncbi:methylenetetrahydrofolate reductase [Apiospora kogelbergensis]|uniref:methylenetetrahydrofolate reductase n=1 Tax=Apiospora kogelbergensis TaxID=1337665 RepID=UPI00312E8F37